MIKYRLTLLLLIIVFSLNAQENNSSLLQKISLYSSVDSLPIKNVLVTIVDSNYKTITNEEGVFEIQNYKAEDKIILNKAGIFSDTLDANELENNNVFYIKTFVDKINTDEFSEEDLAKLIFEIRKTRNFKHHKSKGYVYTEGIKNGRQMEVSEVYHNVTLTDYEVEYLDLKNGRIASLNHDSIEHMQLVILAERFLHYDMFSKGDFKMKTPLNFSKKELLNHYHMIPIQRNIIGTDTILKLRIEKKKLEERLFNAVFWIDLESGQMLKHRLEIESKTMYKDSEKSHYKEKISKEQIEMDYTYINGSMLPSFTDIYVSKYYKDTNDVKTTFEIKTALVLYDYQNPFQPPFINEFEDKSSTYQIMSPCFYDEFFWKNNCQLKYANNNARNRFFKQYYVNKMNSDKFVEFGGNVVKPRFIPWSYDRLVLTYDNIYPSGRYAENADAHVFKFAIQSYLDINTYNDSTIAFSKLVYNTEESYYGYEISLKTQVFFNIYFDFLEVRRREFVKEINEKKLSEEEIKNIHLRFMKENEALRIKLFRDIERGNNEEQLKEWNEYILKELGINNIEIFNQFMDQLIEERNKNKSDTTGTN